MLPKLKKAQVVDAGALGMYIFFEGFFYSLAEVENNHRPVTEVFKNSLRIAAKRLITKEEFEGYYELLQFNKIDLYYTKREFFAYLALDYFHIESIFYGEDHTGWDTHITLHIS